MSEDRVRWEKKQAVKEKNEFPFNKEAKSSRNFAGIRRSFYKYEKVFLLFTKTLCT